MHTAVGARFIMSRVARKIGIFTVFNNEPSVFFQYVPLQNDIRQSRQGLQRIWRIGKNQIVFDSAGAQELEHIAANHTQVPYSQLTATADNPVLLHMGDLHCRYFTSSATHTLDTDTACTGEQIQHVYAFKVHPVVEQIE